MHVLKMVNGSTIIAGEGDGNYIGSKVIVEELVEINELDRLLELEGAVYQWLLKNPNEADDLVQKMRALVMGEPASTQSTNE